MTPPDGGATSSAIYERLRGLIAGGYLGRGERLPTVRQTAADFGVAPGTAARAFKQLEKDGLVETRTGGGTRVAEGASPLPGPVVVRLRDLVELAQESDVTIEELHGALAAIWSAAG
ncbi:GntR family transcriptional regulator [Microbacterium sp. 5K110]|jgi:DNA-binding transcriptional regulator YhcF (GntR family)|uniref:GntR family transcriptional regulator n=1 Tax=unclassified Microbacterium TaxID=2609290 RepID=UPI0010FE0C9B|nr:GntR family transcriptional regulator [Microbacterium sp. 5K110]TLF29029.1 GntR family transcriptional regulator [Microbacterium sp. 5K110]